MIRIQEVFMGLNFKRSALTAVLAVLFSCTAVPKEHSDDFASNIRHEDIVQAVTKLAELGVPLQKDPKGDVRWIEAKKGELKEESMRLLPHLPKLEWLEIGNSVLTQDFIKHLGKCTNSLKLCRFNAHKSMEDFSKILIPSIRLRF